MEAQELRKRAQEYVALEQNAVFRQQVEDLLQADDIAELDERFYRDLEFGTGGLRGIIGGGFNRMNNLVIRKATAGLARYVKKHSTAEHLSAVIGHDSRHFSREFSLEAARVFAAYGIKAYLFQDLRPTPQVSFAVRELGASTGIMVTASHNPPEYNGYKVYWDDGAQVVAPHDTGIIDEVLQAEIPADIPEADQAISAGLIEYLDIDFDSKFFDMAIQNLVNPRVFSDNAKDFLLVYTPLHGTGAYPIESVLQRLGVSFITVPEQREPDGDFPTVSFPNPEEAAAMDMALALAKKKNASIVMGTDPDSDRLGIAVPDDRNPGEWVLLNGNELGILLVDYVFSAHSAAGTLPSTPVFINTIVTTELQNRLAESYGAATYRTLTGFKHIANIIRMLEKKYSSDNFVMGDEESYGFMFGTSVRDKDAVSAVLLTLEAALHNRCKGKTLQERLREIYHEYGWYRETMISKYFTGQEGVQIMAGMMERFRANPPKKIGTRRIFQVKDYKTGYTIDPGRDCSVQDINLPSSNVLQFFADDGTVLSVRPSGTEPKIKFYCSVHTERGMTESDARTYLDSATKEIGDAVQQWIAEAEKSNGGNS